ncbi:hypothetical protein ACFRCG_39700 [Embleya sp. NPDC056575]|uniref:hypothetical protein n=1 Tax=unclassified Embleya TaxID=2699296 RepID=UPI00368DFE02
MATRMWDHVDMPTEDAVTQLRTAVRTFKRADKAVKDARTHRDEAIAAALRAGIKPKAVVDETGLTAEQIRRIAREHDVPRLREPTVTSRRKQESDET